MTRLALTTLLLSACSIERPSNPVADPPPGAAEVEAAALEEWSAALDIDLGDPPPIIWFEGRCLDYSDDTYCEEGRTSFVPGDVEIHIAARPVASETSLAHELMHWALHEARGDWDGRHEADEWTLVEPLQVELSARGW